MTATQVPARGTLQPRQKELVRTNIRWLRQALALLNNIDDEAFATSPKGLAPHKAGSHLRHVIEFYECFLDGLEWSQIDYDARKRDDLLGRNRLVAADRIRGIIRRLETEPALLGDNSLWVRMEDADSVGARDPYLISSVGRELQVLGSHTIHHFALIAIVLRAHGVELDADFGMAPSTLRYQVTMREAA